ncbi:rRNA cytosine-C5-methylase [Acidipropionibacterium acidipropionici]|uniref:rRNA cytosine-C5-methylase n=1 Tax=Acidipropionibacterium acidipropionici TaxID=1748 RepID=A0AAC8YCU9_9ACTN|nr:transcription antitermination factor NusB [Acidipropionibacterium acidipropionici]AMS04486.1 rRNA cytosine-C5-methylase [Acidipropionibacterium acidipropionici]AOZ45979.1 rRNA cytosine-C5-methylase [Acidipropionibacterium acidipropionici]AZP38002.1 rRNA cytosine-C5-methylase [Acidipropionibacterium acidipropionici]
MAHQQRRGRRPATPPDPARTAAFRALMAVESEGAYANLAVSEAISRAHLSGRDAAFATELVDGTARGLGTWDAVLAAASGRRPVDLQPAVRTVLRMACHQILATRVPVRAAVDTSVSLARAQIGERVTGLVNAVSRKIARHDLDGWAEELGADPLERTALRTLHPRWIVSEVTALLGAEEAEKALAADNLAPVPTLVVRPGLAEVPELVEAGATACRYSPYGATRPGNPAEVPAVAQGRAGVQDEGSQLVALALARAADQGPWLDLCSGPGGKAALLAGLAADRDHDLVAVEIHPHRADMVARALAPLPGRHQVVVADGRRTPWNPGTFGAVLADVPCSGLGSLRRRPESRWRRKPGDLQDLQRLQKELLASAVDSAAPGAAIGYVTCSPAAAETLDVTGWALETLPVDLLDAPALMPEVPDAATGPGGRCLQLWPHRHGTDAMFCALLRKHHR